jgi:hypothetical protein
VASAGRVHKLFSVFIICIWLPQVYDSLKQSAGMPEEVLEFFSQEGGQHRLYELRFLPVSKRAAPALYMAENNVDQRVRGCHPSPASTDPAHRQQRSDVSLATFHPDTHVRHSIGPVGC